MKRSSVAAFVSLALVAGGCAEEDALPPPASLDATDDAPTAKESPEIRAVTPSCTPGVVEMCKLYYVTRSGSMAINNCVDSTRVCGPSSTWGACGDTE